VQVRAAAAAAAMAVLLGLAAVGTRGDGSGSTAPPGTAAASTAGHHALIVVIVVLTPILAVLGGALFIYAQIFRLRERDAEAVKRVKRNRRRVAIAFAVFLAIEAYALRTGRQPFGFLHLHNPFSSGDTRTHGIATPQHVPRTAHTAITGTDWTAIVLIWVLLLAAAAILAMRYRASRGPLAAMAVPADVEETSEPEVVRLRRERNPRRAVIAAYAAMERLMARDGIPRDPHEAPMEYLGRVTLHGHRGVAAVHRLTALFQRARFSHRPVDEEMRGRAIAAVEELEGERGAGE
jgi:heme/copper-type cytochrome/quinol oxidase subunit 2